MSGFDAKQNDLTAVILPGGVTMTSDLGVDERIITSAIQTVMNGTT